MAQILLENKQDLQETRIAFLCPPSFEYVMTQWATWQAGAIAVPKELKACDKFNLLEAPSSEPKTATKGFAAT